MKMIVNNMKICIPIIILLLSIFFITSNANSQSSKYTYEDEKDFNTCGTDSDKFTRDKVTVYRRGKKFATIYNPPNTFRDRYTNAKPNQYHLKVCTLYGSWPVDKWMVHCSGSTGSRYSCESREDCIESMKNNCEY
jgi:hypothetical protein